MKKILVCCLIVMFSIFSVSNFIGCKCQPDKPKKPEQPVIQPKPPEPPPVVKPPEPKAKEFISTITEQAGVWTIKLNKSAIYAVKYKDVVVRLNIGYLTYEADLNDLKGDVVEIKPEWHPEGRVTAGLWSRAGPKYLSSVFIKNIEAKLPKEAKAESVEKMESTEKTEVSVEKWSDLMKKLATPIVQANYWDSLMVYPQLYPPERDVDKSLDKMDEAWK